MKKDINIAIGSRVRKARQALGLSRGTVAEMLGISTLFLGYIECGQKGMSLETLSSMCRVLHVTADYLLLGRDSEYVDRSTVNSLVNQVDKEYYPVLEENLRLFLKTITVVESNSDEQGHSPSQMLQETSAIPFAARSGDDSTIVVDGDTAEKLKHALEDLNLSEQPALL